MILVDCCLYSLQSNTTSATKPFQCLVPIQRFIKDFISDASFCFQSSVFLPSIVAAYGFWVASLSLFCQKLSCVWDYNASWWFFWPGRCEWLGSVGVRFLGVEQHHCPLTAIKSLEELDLPPSSKSLVLPTACGIENLYVKDSAFKSMWLEEPANIAHISHHRRHRWWCVFPSQCEEGTQNFGLF